MNYYQTQDLNIATALTVDGFEIDKIKMDDYGRVTFIFNQSEELEKAVDDFRTNKMVLAAQSLLIKYRQLKAIVREIKTNSFNKDIGNNFRE